jgi:hypothetical protein
LLPEELIVDSFQVKSQVSEIKGINLPEEALRQLELFRRGVKPIKLARPARVEDGIVRIAPDEQDALTSLHDQASLKGRMLKFVPASGAASRMFKDWHRVCQKGQFDTAEASLRFINDIPKYAFYQDLKQSMALDGQEIGAYLRDGRFADILEYLLTPKGLNYAWLPKALLKFHTYPDCKRTALEEHLVEAALYVRDDRNICRVHFTVSEEHESRFRDLLGRVKGHYERACGVRFEVTVSTQLSATDTIVVDTENRPFRDRSGNIVFRPGGHGALLQNLNTIDGDIIFLKNIDNVVPDRLKATTVLYKKILGGYLIRLQNQIFQFLRHLSGKKVDEEVSSGMFSFYKEKLSGVLPEAFVGFSSGAKLEWIQQKLNRPLRVCGMVKNEGEPGGGPFWVAEEDHTESLQIVEESQIDSNSEDQRRIWKSSTHFNPVDIVCAVRDYRGEKFDLNRYVNRESVTISRKSHEANEIKALELPGLWNGSMADWNTVFIEVPIETFNPVKTIDDLLRKSHMPS